MFNIYTTNLITALFAVLATTFYFHSNNHETLGGNALNNNYPPASLGDSVSAGVSCPADNTTLSNNTRTINEDEDAKDDDRRKTAPTYSIKISTANSFLPYLYFDNWGRRSGYWVIENLPVSLISHPDEKRIIVTLWSSRISSTCTDTVPAVDKITGCANHFELEFLFDRIQCAVSKHHPQLCSGIFQFTVPHIKVDSRLRIIASIDVPDHVIRDGNTDMKTFVEFSSPLLMDEIYLSVERPDDWLDITSEGYNGTAFPPDSREAALSRVLLQSLSLARSNISKLTEEDLALPGWSGFQFRHFLNNLGSTAPGMRYLEIGIYRGSTLFSVMKSNSISLVAIDSWRDTDTLKDGADVKKFFLSMVDSYVYNNHVMVIEKDCWSVPLESIKNHLNGSVSVYFFDGPHARADHFLALVHFLPILDDVFIYLVDDWNWDGVRTGTFAAIELLKLEVISKIEVTTSDYSIGDSLWHNGMVGFVLRKADAQRK